MAGSKYSGDDLACMERPVERDVEAIFDTSGKTSGVPLCPICQATMRHHANRGTRATFWACSTHPDCRGLRPG
jgi:ssDNA-binding Zn-finger/Zn-ribbon topoisomerase 1